MQRAATPVAAMTNILVLFILLLFFICSQVALTLPSNDADVVASGDGEEEPSLHGSLRASSHFDEVSIRHQTMPNACNNICLIEFLTFELCLLLPLASQGLRRLSGARKEEMIVDFSTQSDGAPFNHGDYVSNEWLSVHGMSVKVPSEKGGYAPRKQARAFNVSVAPSQGADLSSPSESCPAPGPGVGSGGEPGSKGASCSPKGEGNVLIAQESSGDTSEPNDDERGGAASAL